MATRIMRKMHDRPEPGQSIVVFTDDDRELECTATMMWIEDWAGIMIYHKRKAIDESKAVGWMPATDPRRLKP